MKTKWLIAALAALLLLAGCNGSGSNGNSSSDSNNTGSNNAAPVAAAGPDQNVAVGDTVALDGSASSDPDGDMIGYRWTFSARPAGSAAQLSDPNTASPTFTADLAGTYTVQLTVSDGQTDSPPDSVKIVAAAGNSAPVADAGPDQNVATGSTVTLDGSGSSDADGDNLAYSWSFVSRPSGSSATLSNPNAASPQFVADLDGDYVLQLVVNDGTIDSQPDRVIITAATANSVPVADAGADQNVVAGDTVTLDGSPSSDADGDALVYAWSLVSVPTGSGATLTGADTVSPTFTADIAGDYVVELIVNDGSVNSQSDRVTISAAAANAAPVADAGMDQNVATGQTVTLDGSGSTDADGDMITYDWSFVSRPAGSSASLNNPVSVSPSFSADVDGNYVVELVVNDGSTDSAPDRVTVTAATANSAPTANAGPDQNVNTGVLVTLDGTGSSDPDGDNLTYNWSFVSTPSGSTTSLTNVATATPAFTPDVDGNYVVKLVVNDGSVDSTRDRVTITAATANSTPVADAGIDQSVTMGDMVTLDGSGSSDADADALSYQWSFVSIPAGSSASLNNGGTVSPSFTTDKAGDYVVDLVVNDGSVDSTGDTVRVTAVAPDITLFREGGGIFDPGFNEVGFPYSSTTTANINQVGGGSTVELDTFRLEAIGADFTITNLSAVDRNGAVNPFFDGLSDGMTISAGDQVTFTLSSPKTGGAQADILFQFTIAETGETFAARYLLTTN